MSKVSSLKRSAENFKGILRGAREDLFREKALAEDDFVRSLNNETSGCMSHIAESNAPNRAAERRSIDLGHRIQKIDAVLGRIDRGTFGKCLKQDECEGTGNIELELLLKNPMRKYCQICQEVEDENQARSKKLASCRGTLPGKH